MSESPVFDLDPSWAALERRMEREKNLRLRDLSAQVHDHIRAEISGQLEELVVRLVDQPQCHFRGLGFDMGPKGREKVRAFYEGMIANGAHHFMFDPQRMVASERWVVTEGFMRAVTKGSDLRVSGVTEFEGQDVGVEASYLSESPIRTVWPADENGRIIGEDIWFGSTLNSNVTKL